MENEKELKDYSNFELLGFLANATKTYFGCGGHGKAERNGNAVKAFKAEFERRNLAIPNDDFLCSIGEFNGKGAQ